MLAGCGSAATLPRLEPTVAQRTGWLRAEAVHGAALDACSFWRLAARLSLKGNREASVYWMRRANRIGWPVICPM